MDAFPSWQTLALVTTLLQGLTAGSVSARIAIGRAWIDGHVTLVSSIAAAAQTCYVLESRLVLAHGSSGAGIVSTVTGLLLAIDAGISWLAIAPVALGQILALAAVVARLGSALVNVLFATPSGESSRAEALNVMAHGYAQSTVMAGSLSANYSFALFTALGAGCVSSHVAGTFVATLRSCRSLVVVQGTRRAGCQARCRICSRSTLGAT